MHRSKRSGVTLVQIVIVCGCCVILGGIMVVYLGGRSDAARSAHCRMNLRNIAVAAHDYHDAHSRLPYGTLGSDTIPTLAEWDSTGWQKHQMTSGLAAIMPFLDMVQAHEKFDPVAFDYEKDLTEILDYQGKQKYSWFGEINGYAGALKNEQSELFKCPTDNSVPTDIEFVIAVHPVLPEDPKAETDRMWTMTYGQLCKQKTAAKNWSGALPFTHTNYLGCAGAHAGGVQPLYALQKFNGPMSTGPKVQLEAIAHQDGTSRTVMFGESIGEFKDGKRIQMQTYCLGGLARGRGLVPWGENPTESKPLFGTTDRASVFGFGSMHQGFVNFAFCDAAVYQLSHDIDIKVFDQLCASNDGSNPDMDAIYKQQ